MSHGYHGQSEPSAGNGPWRDEMYGSSAGPATYASRANAYGDPYSNNSSRPTSGGNGGGSGGGGGGMMMGPASSGGGDPYSRGGNGYPSNAGGVDYDYPTPEFGRSTTGIYGLTSNSSAQPTMMSRATTSAMSERMPSNRYLSGRGGGYPGSAPSTPGYTTKPPAVNPQQASQQPQPSSASSQQAPLSGNSAGGRAGIGMPTQGYPSLRGPGAPNSGPASMGGGYPSDMSQLRHSNGGNPPGGMINSGMNTGGVGRSIRRSVVTKPPPDEASPMPPPSDPVEPNLPRPKVSRRYQPYTKLPRQPDLARAVLVKNARYKHNNASNSADGSTKHVLTCPNCRGFLKIPKSAVLMHCPTCSTVSPASSSANQQQSSQSQQR